MKKYLSALVVSGILLVGIPTIAAEGNDPNLEGCNKVYNACNADADNFFEDVICTASYGYCKVAAVASRIYHEIVD